jgi:hypothetical protein
MYMRVTAPDLHVLRAAAERRLRTTLRGAARYRGMLVIVLWQAPVPTIGPDGSVGLFFGSGLDEIVGVSCDSRNRGIAYRSAAAEFDYNLTPELRLEATLQRYTSNDAANSTAGGLQLRGDWHWAGVGAGVAIIPLLDDIMDLTGPAPSVYLRLGPAERLHARADMWPARAFGTQQVVRLGAGWNATRRDRVSAFVGAATIGSNGDGEGVAAELTLPVHERLALRMIGHTGNGREHPISGLMVGARFLLH